MPDPWAYWAATENFANGKWVLTDDEMADTLAQIHLQGGHLTQYVRIEENAWAFRQSPGHPLQMAVFHRLGYPRLANIFLSILAAWALYLFLATKYSEVIACAGVTMLLWSPISLLALHYYNMDTFASGVLPLIAGALLLRDGEREKHGWRNFYLFFTVGFVLGWSVVVRLANFFILGLFGVYLVFLQVQRKDLQSFAQLVRNRSCRVGAFSGWLIVATLGLGSLLALSFLAIYNQIVFGRIFASGYLYSSPDSSFFLWAQNPAASLPGGYATWLAGGKLSDIIASLGDHIRLWVRPVTFAWPLWPLAVIGLIKMFREKNIKYPRWFIVSWFFAVYVNQAGVVYFGVTRALTVPFNQTWGFFVAARYLFPVSFPLIWLTVHSLAHKSYQVVLGITLCYIVGGAWLFFEVLSR